MILIHDVYHLIMNYFWIRTSYLSSHCCVQNPSWAELRNFVHFLNTQLQDFEKSDYCSVILKEDLPGFPVFVLRFLIQMSKVVYFFFIRMYITWNLIIINWVNYFKLMILNIVNLCQGFLNKVIGYKWGKNKLWYGDNHWRRGWRLHIDRGRRYFIWNWFGY